VLNSAPRPVRRPKLRERIVAAAFDSLSAGMEREIVSPWRRELLAETRGRVLDVGAGTGANLPYFPWQSERLEVVLLDPSAGMLERAQRRSEQLGVTVQLVDSPAERIPFADEYFDTVVFSMTLCTIADPVSALREAHRVLRSDGRLLVIEHVRADEPDLARWQDRLDGLWKTINIGCHINRATRQAIEAAGFEWEHVEEFRERRIPTAIAQPHLIGVARKRGQRRDPGR
jgi:ubiquinone/menaquinone biosynthesis C-methylase UbiE